SVASLAACSDDSSSSSTTLFAGDVREELVRLTVQEFASENLDVDRECVRAIAADLSDADAQAIVAAYPNGNRSVSDAGEATSARLLTCVDRDQLLDTLVASILATAPVTEDCVRAALAPLDVEQLAALFQNQD